jgi:hypothetical protein
MKSHCMMTEIERERERDGGTNGMKMKASGDKILIVTFCIY